MVRLFQFFFSIDGSNNSNFPFLFFFFLKKGKSSYVRQVATLALLAQLGSYVPVESMRLRPFDGIYVRMGASDSLSAGHSTFFVELHETSSMLARATSRSLLLLDELGRGTSTADGTAIAHATLSHVATQLRAACLFVTHYPQIGVELASTEPDIVTNAHLGYHEQTQTDEDGESVQNITFLYKLTPGVAPASYGLNVARMAGLDSAILKSAARVSQKLQEAGDNNALMHKFSETIRSIEP